MYCCPCGEQCSANTLLGHYRQCDKLHALLVDEYKRIAEEHGSLSVAGKVWNRERADGLPNSKMVAKMYGHYYFLQQRAIGGEVVEHNGTWYWLPDVPEDWHCALKPGQSISESCDIALIYDLLIQMINVAHSESKGSMNHWKPYRSEEEMADIADEAREAINRLQSAHRSGASWMKTVKGSRYLSE